MAETIRYIGPSWKEAAEIVEKFNLPLICRLTGSMICSRLVIRFKNEREVSFLGKSRCRNMFRCHRSVQTMTWSVNTLVPISWISQ